MAYPPQYIQNISASIHATTKLFVPFCSAPDGESDDMICLVFWVYCKNGKIWTKRQVYNKGISPISGIISKYEILIFTIVQMILRDMM